MKDMSHGSLSRPILWARIAGAHLPVERDGRAFQEHLAEIAGIDPDAARALEREYRRFLYIAAIAEAPREPPGPVYLAWTYHAGLDGYAEDFCPWVLGRRVMPGPAPEGFGAAYLAARIDYIAEFGAAPPEEFWPDPGPVLACLRSQIPGAEPPLPQHYR